MTVGLVLGAGIGAGLLIVAVAVWTPVRPPLRQALAALDGPSGNGGEESEGTGRLRRSLVAAVRRWDGSMSGLLTDAAELRVVGRSIEEQVVAKLAYAAALAVLPAATVAVSRAAGAAVSLTLAVLPAVVLAVVGFVLPDLKIRARATERREEFNRDLSSYLDLVAILLAGGSGTEPALYRAAEAGTGWVFSELQAALDRCRLTGQTPWHSLAQLGDDLGVPELTELAATTGLAGSQGARIRESLGQRARSLRSRQLAEVETAAETATERMTVPVVILAAGFVAFVGYPAVSTVLNGL